MKRLLTLAALTSLALSGSAFAQAPDAAVDTQATTSMEQPASAPAEHAHKHAGHVAKDGKAHHCKNKHCKKHAGAVVHKAH